MERYADELGGALAARGGFAIEQIAPEASPWARLPFLGAFDRRLTRFFGYRRRLNRHPADLYHITDHSYADLAAVLPPERTIVTCHDLILLRAEQQSLGFRGRWAVRQMFRHRVARLRDVAHVACISEQTRTDLIELVGVDPARTSVIPNGVDPRFAPLSEDRRASLRAAVAPAERAVLLHVSTGDDYKNVEGTLHTLAALHASGRDAILLRAGRPLSPAQSELARSLGISDAVRDLDRVSDDRLVELYCLADVLLFPSHYEGFGWPPLEAMACGTPVVTSQAAALVEVTGDAALHAPADDPQALADAVRSVLDDGELAARLTRDGIARAGQYRWEDTAAAFDALYRRVLAEASRPV